MIARTAFYGTNLAKIETKMSHRMAVWDNFSGKTRKSVSYI